MQSTSFSVFSNPRDFSRGSILDQLRSAVIPSGSYISQLSSNIEERESALRSLDAEILPLRATLANLEQVRENLQSVQHQEKGLFSPIRQLPVEILEKIFSLCAESEMPIVFDQRLRSQVLRLSQVCHHWREITEGAPQLWACGTWVIYRDDDEQYSMLAHFLSKSQNALLNLELTCATKCNSEETLRLLLGHSNRWGSVTLILHEYMRDWVTEELRTRPRPVDGYFPNLQSLTIEDGYLRPLSRVYMFEIAPKLSSLQIYSLTDRFALPYSQLKALRLHHKCDDLTTVTLMRQCHALEKLDFLIGKDFDVHSLPCATYPTISTLVLRSYHLDDCSKVFRTLMFPSLKRLKLIRPPSGNDPHPWPAEVFQSLISSSGCALEMLKIDGLFFMTKDQIYETYRVLPNLTHLKICCHRSFSKEANEMPHITTLFDSLTIESTVQSKHQVLLPRLSHLAVEEILLDTDLADKIVEMVESRKRLDIPGVACLGNLEFVGYNRSTGADFSEILNRVNPRLISSGPTERPGVREWYTRLSL